jgi:hypothetical protein
MEIKIPNWSAISLAQTSKNPVTYPNWRAFLASQLPEQQLDHVPLLFFSVNHTNYRVRWEGRRLGRKKKNKKHLHKNTEV